MYIPIWIRSSSFEGMCILSPGCHIPFKMKMRFRPNSPLCIGAQQDLCPPGGTSGFRCSVVQFGFNFILIFTEKEKTGSRKPRYWVFETNLAFPESPLGNPGKHPQDFTGKLFFFGKSGFLFFQIGPLGWGAAWCSVVVFFCFFFIPKMTCQSPKTGGSNPSYGRVHKTFSIKHRL